MNTNFESGKARVFGVFFGAFSSKNQEWSEKAMLRDKLAKLFNARYVSDSSVVTHTEFQTNWHQFDFKK